MSGTSGRRLLGVLAVVASLSGAAHAHEAFREYIWHRVQLDVNARHVDVTLELTFFEDGSARERQRMDTNSDGRIQRSEIDAYANRIAMAVTPKLSLLLAGQRAPLIPLYSPEINLLGRETADGGHLQLTLRFFSAKPNEFPIGSAITVEDRLWPDARSLAEISTRNSAAPSLDAGKVIDRPFPASGDDALRFTAHYIKVGLALRAGLNESQAIVQAACGEAAPPLGTVWEMIVIAKRAVAIQPFDRLTALSGVEGLDYFVVPQSGTSRNDRIPKQPLVARAWRPSHNRITLPPKSCFPSLSGAG